MKKILSITALLLCSIFVTAQFKGLKEKVLGGVNPVAAIFKKPAPITTSFDEKMLVSTLPETFGNEKNYAPLYKMKTVEGGGFSLCPGFYEMTNMSYCLKAGTHGPSQGDGYLFAITQGKMEEVVNAILSNHAIKHPEIPQHDVQVILWAIIARAKFENLSNRLKVVTSLLLTPKQIVQLNGGFAETIGDAAMKKGLIDLPPAAQKVIQAENNIRKLVETGIDNYEDFEHYAILAGMATVDRTDVVRGMWSLHPDGYYIRYFPSGYSKTKVQIYVPESKKHVVYNAVGTIACPANTGAQRLAQTNLPIVKVDATFTNPCFPIIEGQPAGNNPNQPADTIKLLNGYVDLHTHPMSYLGFGRKAMYGVPDIGCLMPVGTKDCNSTPFRAVTIQDAMGNCNSTHGGWGLDNQCGDYLRATLINYAMDDKFIHKYEPQNNLHGDHPHAGFPDFSYWPNQTSILHQQMWWEWIKRAYQGGLRVMVALAVNNELLAEILNGEKPYDDKTTADLQIEELKSFVGRHNDFMEVAYSASDLRRIISSNKLAVVLGIEVDKLGNFGKPGVITNEFTVRAEIQRLYQKGIRYAFPIHLIDNSFGGTAVYDLMFNFANRQANGYYFRVKSSNDKKITYRTNLTEGPQGLENKLILGIGAAVQRVADLPAPCFNDVIKCAPLPGRLRCCGSFESITKIFNPSPEFDIYKLIGGGHVNSLGITRLGNVAINEMMKLGMMIDVDHMSELSMTNIIDYAESISGGYPLNMGHNGIRVDSSNERSAPEHLIKRIASLGGMLGVGTADITPDEFASNYSAVWTAMSNRGVGIGTDANGFEPLPKAREIKDITQIIARNQYFYTKFFEDSLIKASPIKTKSGITGSTRQWDYLKEKGVAHYGLMPEFLFDVKYSTVGPAVINNLMQSAEHFAQMWTKCETVSKNVSSSPLAGTYTYNINPVNNLCPNQLVSGDRDFGGHGPRVSGSITIKISSDGLNLQAVISFNAKETINDWSEVKGSWTVNIGEPAPAGMRYSKINSSLVSTFDKVLIGGGGNELFDGCDGGLHIISPLNGPVSQVIVVGDTGGNDISADNDCNCDTRIHRIDFNPISVTIVPR